MCYNCLILSLTMGIKWDVQYCLRDWHLQPLVERAEQYLFCSCNFIWQKASINIVKKGLAKLWETRQVKVFLKCNFLSYWCSLSGFLTPYNQGTFATNIFPYTKPHKKTNHLLQKKHCSKYLQIRSGLQIRHLEKTQE